MPQVYWGIQTFGLGQVSCWWVWIPCPCYWVWMDDARMWKETKNHLCITTFIILYSNINSYIQYDKIQYMIAHCDHRIHYNMWIQSFTCVGNTDRWYVNNQNQWIQPILHARILHDIQCIPLSQSIDIGNITIIINHNLCN